VLERLRRCFRLAIALRLRFSMGVSKWRCFFMSGKMPAFDTSRLKRRSVDSIPSLSPGITWVIPSPFSISNEDTNYSKIVAAGKEKLKSTLRPEVQDLDLSMHNVE
jgi:hypothetical protein